MWGHPILFLSIKVGSGISSKYPPALPGDTYCSCKEEIVESINPKQDIQS